MNECEESKFSKPNSLYRDKDCSDIFVSMVFLQPICQKFLIHPEARNKMKRRRTFAYEQEADHNYIASVCIRKFDRLVA